jgi:hypothetical protein
MTVRILFAQEYGWEAKEIATVFENIPYLNITKIIRQQKSFDSLKQSDFDLIFTYGPHTGSMMPLLQWIKQGEPEQSPQLIWWLNENIPEIETWNRTKIFGQVRMFLDQSWDYPSFKRDWLQGLGHRYRILAELFWAQQQGISLLVPTTSYRRSEVLCQSHFNSISAPMGWGPSDDLGRDLQLKRDIPVVWVGSLPHLRSRRTIIMQRLIKELTQRGVKIQLYTKNLRGQQRTEVLNRSKILLNLLRHPLDFTGHRLILGAANKALLISETMVDSLPFEPNKHMIQVPINQLADQIIYYLEHEEEREKIVNVAYDLVMNKLTMENSVKQVLKACGV